MTQVVTEQGCWQLRRHSVLFEEFSSLMKSVNICVNTAKYARCYSHCPCLQNKREHPNRVKGFVETVVPNYCDPTFASHFRMKRQTFQMNDNPLLTSETVLWSIIDLIIFIVCIRLIIIAITVVVLWYCNIYHYIIREHRKMLWKCHSTIQ